MKQWMWEEEEEEARQEGENRTAYEVRVPYGCRAEVSLIRRSE